MFCESTSRGPVIRAYMEMYIVLRINKLELLGDRQVVLRATRFRMRGAADPPTPLDHVLQDDLGF